MLFPADLKYTKEHAWVRVEGAEALVGITDHAQKELGDIVFVELPRVGTRLKKGETLGSVESVKAVSDIYAPVSGEVVEVNKGLESAPETANRDPHGEGWLVVLKMADPSETKGLLDAATYERALQG
jgi:glycine cleavage system H protein